MVPPKASSVRYVRFFEAMLSVLDAYVCIKVSASSSGDQATITFKWECEGTGPLLLMALPHHMDTLQAPTTKGIR
jgi:endoglucanase Acf2